MTTINIIIIIIAMGIVVITIIIISIIRITIMVVATLIVIISNYWVPLQVLGGAVRSRRYDAA